MAGTGFALVLRSLLAQRSMSLRALARQVPTDVSHLSRVLSGERPATVQLAQRCEEILDAPGVLQAALSRESSTTVPSEAVERVWNVAPPVMGFLGRDQALSGLREQLSTATSDVAVAVVHGIPGVGKTQLARAYADRHRTTYGVGWWVTAETPLETRAGLTELAVRLGAADTWSPREIIAYLFDALAERSDWLLILDNVAGPAGADDFLPRRCAGAGHVIITSRSPAWQALGAPAPLDALDLSDAARLLGGSTVQPGGWARRLAEELGCLPLALGQAAAYTAEAGITVEEYLGLFRRERARLLDCGSAVAYVGSVSAAITLSVTMLKSTSPLAHHVLEVCSLLSGDVLPLRDIVAGLTPTTADGTTDSVAQLQTTVDLRQSGLLTLDTGEDARLHRLTRMVVQERIDDRRARAIDAVAMVAGLFPSVPSEPRSWPQCARLVSHAHAVIEHARRATVVDEPLALLATRVGRYLLCTGLDFAAARDLHTLALDQRRALHDGDHPETARALVHLAVDLNELGQTAEALRLHEDALTMRRRLYPDDHPDTAHSLDNLGNILHRLGDHVNARSRHEQGLKMRRRLHPEDHPNVAYSLSNLAADLRALGDPTKARDLDEQALAMRLRLDLGDHPDVAHSLSNLAADLHALGDHIGAVDLEERSLVMRQALYPAGHPETTTSQARLNTMRRVRDAPTTPVVDLDARSEVP